MQPVCWVPSEWTAEAIYIQLRQNGPAMWCEHGHGQTTILSLSASPPWSPGAWPGQIIAGLSPTNGALPRVAGWISYEAGRWFEQMPAPRQPPPLPLVWLGVTTLTIEVRPGGVQLSGAPEPVAHWAALLAGSPPPPPVLGRPRGVRIAKDDRGWYEAGVERVLQHLRAGDCYQVNLSRRIEVETDEDPLYVWLRLRSSNPARRGVLLETPHGAIVSNSPELLLSARGHHLRSVPIKGTASRAGGVEAAQALLRSAKERAELTMIVDLVRSDLGRVAAPGSIHAGRRRVGAVGHVWHAMQAVEAQLAEGQNAISALAALFPAGSVTGAPKVRAMEIIGALEPVPRGVYCGSLGWFGPGDEAFWNVAIRTITFSPSGVSFHVGAGLVIGSDPRREYEETELKALRLLEALVA